jgi:enamine deaminase RidA (YjgF/YER057c/UK114 family)
VSHLRLTVLIVLVLMVNTNSSDAQTAPRLRNPETMHAPRGYSHVAEVPPGSRMVFIAGQVALDKSGALVGPGDFRAQATQVFENLRLALADVGVTFKDVVKLNYYLIDVEQAPIVREVRNGYLDTAAPPVSTLVEVRRLFRDDVLLEVEAVAVVRDR